MRVPKHYRLRTLLIALAVLPPVSAAAYRYYVAHLELAAAMSQADNETEPDPFRPVIVTQPSFKR